MTLVLLTESPGVCYSAQVSLYGRSGAPANVTWSLQNMMIEDSLHDCCSPPASFHYFIIS